jgi:hypothetical protein
MGSSVIVSGIEQLAAQAEMIKRRETIVIHRAGFGEGWRKLASARAFFTIFFHPVQTVLIPQG